MSWIGQHSMTKVHFCRSSTIVGLLIQLATFSRWNHVALEINGTIYEADMIYGVRKLPLAPFKRMWTETRAVEVDVPNMLALYEFMEAQLGKKYDFTAILALPFRRDWQDPEKWYCSEYLAGGLRKGGVPVAVREDAHRVKPNDLWTALP